MAPTRTGSIRPRGSRWQARWQDPDGREHSATLPSRRAAERWLRDTTAEWRRTHGGTPATPSAPSAAPQPAGIPTVAEFAPIWRATLVDQSPATLARTDSALRAHILPHWGDHRLDAITVLAVRQWLAALISEYGLAANTATRLLRIFSALLQTAAETDDRWLTVNPCRGVRPPRATHVERRFLTVGELHRVADAADPRYRGFVLFAGYSGARFAELTALRVRDLDTERGTVRIERTLTEVAGHLHEGGPKSAAGRRTISLPPTIIAAAAANLAGKKPDDLVFTAPEGGPLRRTLFAKRFWKPALERSGLPPAGLHSLRHTAVSIWLQAGASLKEAQSRAGHSSGALTLSIYSHVAPETYAATTARLDEMARTAAD